MRARTKKAPAKARPASWDVQTETTVNGRHLVAHETEVTFRDHDGRNRRARFLERVTAPAGEWFTVAELDPSTGRTRSVRSVSPDRIRTIHAKSRAYKGRK